MSVLPSDIVVYGSANMPEIDGATIGGAVDFTRRVAFYDVTPAGSVDVISSSSSDTATKIAYFGRDPTGAVQGQTLTLNGQSWVTGSQPLERLLYAALSGASANGPLANPGGTPAVGDVALAAHSCVLPIGAVTTDAAVRTAQAGSANHSGTTPALFKLQSGDGAAASTGQLIWTKSGTGANQLRQIIATAGYGTDLVAVSRDWGTVPDNTTTYKILQGMLFEISPNPVTTVIRMFSTSAADMPAGSQRTYYEKIFVVSNNTATALTGAQIEVASETLTLPSGALLDLALTTVLNDTGTVVNRQTAPSSGVGGFITQPAFVSVPSPGNLPSGAAPNAAGAQGVWLRLTLPAGTTAYKGSADLRTQGMTT
ncbi:MAG: hypothetical protein JO282_14445 [Alphaproteobacteria bacterium]|nr:hypothetical protein [Alphaproteobacteria bacterium]